MDLRKNQVTLSELMEDPRSMAVLQKHFGKQLRHPLVKAAKKLTLAQLMDMAGAYLPQKTITGVVEELQRL